MPTQRPLSGVEKKKRSKKRRTRTEVSSSSESDSDVSTKQRSRKVPAVEEEAEDASPATSPAPAPVPTPTKKEKKKPRSTDATKPETNGDIAMEDAPASRPATLISKPAPTASEEFRAIYLRKIASEFADDLDKVREAPDFKASSVPMLIHALKQGESLFSGEERRRVVGAASS